uniref:Laminin subunit gamma-1 n=1 Tax=Ditylenchus dipsaci TaxID=166011 RepID=A0A915EBM3_9BILA
MGLLFGLWLSVSCLVISSAAQPFQRFPITDPNHHQPSTTGACYVDDEFGGRSPKGVQKVVQNFGFRPVEVTDSCGLNGPTNYCVQTYHTSSTHRRSSCEICDSRIPYLTHPASYLTDLHEGNNETWWQSQTMLEGIKYPNSVNLTLRLGKAFDITYVRVKFVSPRPESFRIFKKAHAEENWTPWQYYSGSCRSTYKLPEKAPILPGNEAVAQCNKDFSDISPLTGGNIAFPTLEGRPSAENFEESEVLQNWVTATEIKISLDRMNTFGDEIFGDPRVLRSYYFAISDFAVGGRCKCNGHASQCVKSTGQNQQQLVCDCKHHTNGVDCHQCEPFFVDRPWRPATSTEANECLPCNCNNLSNRCFFDEKLFESTGHGGHCIDCAGNTKGVHCEQCVENHYRKVGDTYCIACQCSDIGSVKKQCGLDGQCACKPGVGGRFCDQCLPGYYDFSNNGCRDCHCLVTGSFNNMPNCSPTDGACQCKVNVEGQRCDKCKPGYFHLATDNQFGCTPCFCFGHSSVCSSADGYYALNLTSNFLNEVEDWRAGSDVSPEDVQWTNNEQAIAISQIDYYPVYFLAPSKFLGDQRFAFNQLISFTLRVQQDFAAGGNKDLVIVGANGRELTITITAQNNPNPSTNPQNYHFRIHSDALLEWSPRLREVDFLGVLSNVTDIKLRGTYSKGDVGYLYHFSIGSASEGLNPELGIPRQHADWVETCRCTQGFTGQFCESCAAGYRRAFKYGGRLSGCVKCECHGHAEGCDSESGACICQDNTAGDTCERCARGYYGDALNGTQEDCHKCDCPDNGACVLLEGDSKQTVCTECPEGYAGQKCEYCASEYFGDPEQGVPCQKCVCSGNIDLNAINNCDRVTGECKKCIMHTSGFNCEQCAAGYWEMHWQSLRETARLATATLLALPDPPTMTCCWSGLQCNQCEARYFNLTSGTGCQQCNCDQLGSEDNGSCDAVTGKCRCKPGVTGFRCDECAIRHFAFGADGCKECDCNVIGSEVLDCDYRNGQCLCYENVEGRSCDQCAENFYSLSDGCLPCDDCYTLIQTRKNVVNSTMSHLRQIMDDFKSGPVSINDTDFHDSVNLVSTQVDELHLRAKTKLENSDNTLLTADYVSVKYQLSQASSTLTEATKKLGALDEQMDQVEDGLEKWNHERGSIGKQLENSLKDLEHKGRHVLSNAEKAVQQHGNADTQLTRMADEAKQLADVQGEKAVEIKRIGEKIIALNQEALAQAQETVYEGPKFAKAVEDLTQSTSATELLLNRTVVFAGKSTKLGTELKETLKNAEIQAFTNTRTIKSAQEEIAHTEEKLLLAKEQFQITEDLLEEVEKAQTRARNAWNTADEVRTDAQQMLKTLTDFDENKENYVEKLRTSMEEVPNTQKNIKAAEKMSTKAKESLGNAEQKAHAALKMAKEAKKEAELYAQQFQELVSSTDQLKSTVDEMLTQLEKLEKSIQKAEDKSHQQVQENSLNRERMEAVLKNAALANQNAQNANRSAQESMDLLNVVNERLNSVEPVQDEELDELETVLTALEKSYANSNIEEIIKEGKQRDKDIHRDDVVAQIRDLHSQLINLENIRDTIPEKCLNLVNLETEDVMKTF